MSAFTYNEVGVLIRWDDDALYQHHYYDPTTGAELPAPQSPTAYTAQEKTHADARTPAATRAANLQKIYTAMTNARANNTTFLGIASPTNAQVVSQVQALTRQNNGIMRVVYGILNGDPSALDGTN